MASLKILLCRDLRRLLLAWKFCATAILVAGLAATATWLRSSDYRAALAQDHDEAVRNEREIEHTGELNRLYDMAPPQVQPGPMAVFHQGVPLTERNAGTTESDISETAFNADPLPVVFPPFDFTNIVLLVLGLLALLASSLGLSGEREAGTWEMLLTHGVAPRAIVLAKWLAHGIVCSLLLFLGMTVALAVTAISGARLSTAGVVSFVLSAGCSLPFLFCLTAIGTLLSAYSSLRTQSIISATGAWMLIAIVLPSAGAYVAASFAPLRDLGEKRRAIERILTDEREASLNKQIAGLYEKDNPELEVFLRPAGISAERFRSLPDSEAENLVTKLAAGNPAFAAFIGKEQSAVLEIIQSTWNTHANRAEQAEQQLEASIGKQNDLILAFTASLPATAYRESLSRVFGLSYRDLLYARTTQKSYKRALVDYIFRRAHEIGGADPFNRRVDLSDRPRFSFVRRNAGARWGTAAPFIFIMAGWTTVSLGLAVRTASARG